MPRAKHCVGLSRLAKGKSITISLLVGMTTDSPGKKSKDSKPSICIIFFPVSILAIIGKSNLSATFSA